MKILPVLSLLFVCIGDLLAQTALPDPSSTDTTPVAGATVITSDELTMDQVSHTSVFTGNVVVVGTNFRMTCNEMTVYSNTANKIDHIVAKENVVILQPERVTHCGQAIYYRNEDKFVLTDQPDILDNKNELSAPEITIFRSDKRLITKGRSTTKIIEKSGPATVSSSPAVKKP